MRRKQFLLSIIILIASSLVMSCGMPQEQYDAVVAERNAAQAEVTSLESDLDKTESDLAETESDLATTESDLAAAQSQISSLQSDLTNAESNLAEAEAQIAKMEALYEFVLFLDNFEDGDTVGWNLEGDWSVIQEGGNYILQGVGPCSADAGPQEWTDYSFEARIKFSQSANVDFRLRTEMGMYFLNIVPEGLTLNKKLLDKSVLAQRGVPLEENQWIDLKIEVEKDTIRLYIDDNWLFLNREI